MTWDGTNLTATAFVGDGSALTGIGGGGFVVLAQASNFAVPTNVTRTADGGMIFDPSSGTEGTYPLKVYAPFGLTTYTLHAKLIPSASTGTVVTACFGSGLQTNDLTSTSVPVEVTYECSPARDADGFITGSIVMYSSGTASNEVAVRSLELRGE